MARKLLNEAAQKVHAAASVSHPEPDTTLAKVHDLSDSQGGVDIGADTGTEALHYRSLHS